MSFFRRLTFLPDIRGLYIREVARLTSFVPTGYRWFPKDALLQSGEPGATLWAFARLTADAAQRIEMQRTSVLLSRLSGDELRAFGNAMNMPIGPVELEDAYAVRLAAFIVAEKVTNNAMVELVRSLDPTVGVLAYDRGQDIWILGDSAGSGAKKLPDQFKFHGGVADFILNKDLPRLMDLVPYYKAQGVYPTYTVLIQTRHDYHGGTDAPQLNGASELFISSAHFERQHAVVETDDGQVGVGASDQYDGFSTAMISVAALVCAVPIRFNQLTQNRFAMPDLDAWAASGVPTHTLVVTPDASYNVFDPTDWQPPMDITFTDATLGDGSVLNDPGLIL